MKKVSEYTVYKITCSANGRCYVGSSRVLSRRRNRHFVDLNNGDHHSPKMQADFEEFGEESFTTDILEKVPSLKLAWEREKFWMLELKAYPDGYNISSETRYPEIGPERRRLVEAANWKTTFSTPEYREMCRGRAIRQFSDPKNREKQSLLQKEQVRKNPEKWKEICSRGGKLGASKAREASRREIIRSDGKVYLAISDAAREMNPEFPEKARSCIKQALKRGSVTLGFRWKYKD